MKTKIALKSRKFFKDSLAKSKKYGLDKEFKWSYTRARKGINFKNNNKTMNQIRRYQQFQGMPYKERSKYI